MGLQLRELQIWELTPLETAAAPSTPNTISEIDDAFQPLARQHHHAEGGNERVTDRGWSAWLAVVAGFINFWAGFGKLLQW